MTTVVDYALMAGASYISSRAEINMFPAPNLWLEHEDERRKGPSGFEATFFTKGSELVISYAGTNPADISGDILTDLSLAAGGLSSQLCQAADYYLSLKNNLLYEDCAFTFTGHSLGGGLASLMAVYFGESATTFDQAPFRRSAVSQTQTIDTGGSTMQHLVAADLLTYLRNKGYNDTQLAKLKAFVDSADPSNPNPIAGDTLAAREQKVANFNTDGEFLTSWPLVPTSNRIGTQAREELGTDHGFPPSVGLYRNDPHGLIRVFRQPKKTKPGVQPGLSFKGQRKIRQRSAPDPDRR